MQRWNTSFKCVNWRVEWGWRGRDHSRVGVPGVESGYASIAGLSLRRDMSVVFLKIKDKLQARSCRYWRQTLLWHPGTLTLRAERQNAGMSKITKWRLNPVWHRMYHVTHMATVGVKRLKTAGNCQNSSGLNRQLLAVDTHLVTTTQRNTPTGCSTRTSALFSSSLYTRALVDSSITGQCWNWPKRTGGEGGGQLPKCLEFCPGIEVYGRFSLKNERLYTWTGGGLGFNPQPPDNSNPVTGWNIHTPQTIRYRAATRLGEKHARRQRNQSQVVNNTKQS